MTGIIRHINQTVKNSFIPSQGSWKKDIIASFSVALVALPLSLGIAYASGAPAISGIISAIMGGIVTTFFRGGHISINGPANSLIVVTVAAASLIASTGYEYVFPAILAAFIFSGVIQIILGLIKMGKISDFFPSSVVIGLLAAIGLIIIGKQIHVAFGADVDTKNTFQMLLQVSETIKNINPFVALISVTSLLILIFHHKIKIKFIHFVPSPIWVLIYSIPMAYLLHFDQAHTISLFGKEYYLGPEHLVQIPSDITHSIVYPDFGLIHHPVFWLAVFLITLVITIESLVSAKAVDKIDPQHRKTNMNKDLAGIGLSTIASGFLGGLPVSTVVVRSSVNVNHGAQTKWSNFYHGIIFLLLILFFAPIIKLVPLAGLASILVFAGYKLISPKVIRDVYRKGQDQFLIFVVTVFAVLQTGILWGIVIGIATTLVIHYVKSGLPLPIFSNYLLRPNIRVIAEDENDYFIKVKGIANFVCILNLLGKIEKLPIDSHIIIDFAHARLVDYTVLEHIHEYAEKFNSNGGRLDITGLSLHDTISDHPYSLHILNPPDLNKIKLTRRQSELKQIAASNNFLYHPEINWNTLKIKSFQFFETRPIEYRKNIIYGKYADVNVNWEVCDITFDEGALIAKEVHHTTVQLLKLPFSIPEFTLQKEDFFNRILEFAGHRDIDFASYKKFSNKVSIKGPDETAIRDFFSPGLIDFFEQNEVYHLESADNRLCIFKHHRLASPKEVEEMISFSKKLVLYLMKEAVDGGENFRAERV